MTNETNVNVGDEVTDSPIGEGKVTGFNPDGYPEINGHAVSYFTRKDGKKYGAFGTLDTPKQKMSPKGPSATAVQPMGLHSMFPQAQGGNAQNVQTAPGFVAHGAAAPLAPATAPAPATATPASTPASTPQTTATPPATPAAPSTPAQPATPAVAPASAPATPLPTVPNEQGGPATVQASAPAKTVAAPPGAITTDSMGITPNAPAVSSTSPDHAASSAVAGPGGEDGKFVDMGAKKS